MESGRHSSLNLFLEDLDSRPLVGLGFVDVLYRSNTRVIEVECIHNFVRTIVGMHLEIIMNINVYYDILYSLTNTKHEALYPTYFHYLESLQDSGQMKSITFVSLVEKVAKCEKYFGK
jgi:hypothetical protein